MANTINSGLIIQNVIKDSVLSTLKTAPVALKEIVKFNASTEAEKGGKVSVPFIDTSNVSSSTFTGSYSLSNMVITPKDVTMKEEYIALAFNGSELQGYNIPDMETVVADATRILVNKAEADVYAIVTSGNYSEEVVCTAANVAGSTLTELRKDLIDAGCPADKLAIVLSPDASAALVEDQADASKLGTTDASVKGKLGMCRGLAVYEAGGLTATGFALAPDAILFANRGVYSQDGIYNIVETFQDPSTGLVFTVKSYADGSANAIKWILSCRYGVAVGNASALVRLDDA